jgi:hypothetical protein
MLRITGNRNEKYDLYTDELKSLVEETLRLSFETEESMRLLGSIRSSAENLRSLVLSAKEQALIREELEFFDTKMKNMVAATFGNLEQYQLTGWQELLDDGEES